MTDCAKGVRSTAYIEPRDSSRMFYRQNVLVRLPCASMCLGVIPMFVNNERVHFLNRYLSATHALGAHYIDPISEGPLLEVPL